MKLIGVRLVVPYGSASWRDANRDFTVKIDDSEDVANLFIGVLQGDMATASPWQPHAAAA